MLTCTSEADRHLFEDSLIIRLVSRHCENTFLFLYFYVGAGHLRTKTMGNSWTLQDPEDVPNYRARANKPSLVARGGVSAPEPQTGSGFIGVAWAEERGGSPKSIPLTEGPQQERGCHRQEVDLSQSITKPQGFTLMNSDSGFVLPLINSLVKIKPTFRLIFNKFEAIK